ncbi:MAG: YlcI/YnfO family protein [Verrucomicrobiales bacterium]
MNVTIKLPDELVHEARHRAIARSQSLSQWVADLLRREIAREHPDRKTLSDRLGDLATAGMDFELPDRQMETERPVAVP